MVQILSDLGFAVEAASTENRQTDEETSSLRSDEETSPLTSYCTNVQI